MQPNEPSQGIESQQSTQYLEGNDPETSQTRYEREKMSALTSNFEEESSSSS